MLHAVADGNRGPVTPPPPPTPQFLLEASAAQATSSVREMTSEQQADLRDEVSRMPEGERDALANALAAKLPTEQLQQLEPVFGTEVIREAVETRSPATVREDYQQLTGTRPDIDAPAGSGRTEQEQVEQAREDYAEQVSGMGLPSNTLLTELMAANAGDPAYLAELVRLADEEGLFDDVVFPIGTLFEKDADGNYVLEDAGDRRDAFALALQAVQLLRTGHGTSADLFIRTRLGGEHGQHHNRKRPARRPPLPAGSRMRRANSASKPLFSSMPRS